MIRKRVNRDAPFIAQELADAPAALFDQQATFRRVQHQTGIASSSREPSKAIGRMAWLPMSSPSSRSLK